MNFILASYPQSIALPIATVAHYDAIAPAAWRSSRLCDGARPPPVYYGLMFRIVAIVVVALAAIDFFVLDGTYLHHVQAMLADMRHHILYR